MPNRVNALKEWTDKAIATIIYDSTVDEFTADGIFDKVKGKENVAIVGFTTDGDVFGVFYSVAVTEQGKDFDDRNIFAFSFESHGRCETPQRFVVKKGLKEMVNVYFFKTAPYGFVDFGVAGLGGFWLGNERSNSFCTDLSDGFAGIKDTTLTGQNGTYPDGPFHHCARLVAIQLE